MIPRLKPFIGFEEIAALFRPVNDAVQKFESAFAATFSTRHAVAFPYGRSALWAFFKAMGIEGAEIVQPAYTCSVVGHATVLSGNIPVFVDINLHDYNMDLDAFRKAITAKTRAVLPTHLFGYPMDVDAVNQIVHEAENRFGQRIYIIQDCAHSFEAEWQGKSVVNAGDGALFGLNISKQITSIFGGMFTTNDDEIAAKLLALRERSYSEKSWSEKLFRLFYLPVATIAFNDLIYGFTYWLQNNTGLLRQLTDAYHLDEKIHFPPDYLKRLSPVEARVGLEQMGKYNTIKSRRREIAAMYFDQLKVPDTWVMPPNVEGATYSHFVIRVPNRNEVMKLAAQHGVQLGQLIEYSMPHLPAYQKYSSNNQYPNSLLCSQSLINLPIHPGLNQKDLFKIIETISHI
ncbi:MAG: DegT/DnrJ/EryC1/StrS aminotransferase family protein [Pelolinea sp.]|nr:DegT/DnrJ/EryC1/StrS aminotransferase family protein [Pelolinea sp.]